MWKLQAQVDQQAKQKAAAEAAPAANSTTSATRIPSKELQKQRLAAKEKGAGKTDIVRTGTSSQGRSPTEIRLASEVADLDASATPGVECSWPNKKDLLNFEVKVKPMDGLYKGAQFKFLCKVPKGYPHDAPTVTCETRVFHPNIDFNGRVCLNILRADWNPCLGVSHVLMGLQHLFLEPNPDDPLNTEAADMMVKNYAQFKDTVQKALNGAHIAGHQFPKLL